MDTLCKNIGHVHQSYSSSVLWIGGDLNLPDIICWNRTKVTGMQYPKILPEKLLELAEDLNPQHETYVVTFPTWKDVTLDLFLTNRQSLIGRCESLPALSDHEIVLVISEVGAKRQKPVKRKIQLWKKADFDAIRKEIAVFNTQFHTTFSTEVLSRQCGDLSSRSCLKLWTNLFHPNLLLRGIINRNFDRQSDATQKATTLI